MKKEFNLSKREWDVIITGYNGTKYHKGYLKSDVKEAVRLLKEKDFIMSILAEDVTMDEEERMKFIDVEGVRNKIDKIFGEKLK